MKKIRAGRWIALLSVILSVSFNEIYRIIFPQKEKIVDITQLYYTHFTPAGYVFSIWGLIYLSFIIYGVYQLLPRQRDLTFPDQVALSFTAVNLLTMAWIVAFTSGFITLSVVFMFMLLILSFFLFSQVHRHSENLWMQFTFSVFFGWVTVATSAAITTWMAYRGIEAANDTNVTDLFIALVCLIGIFVSYLYKDLFYPAVVCWAVCGIYIKNKYMVDKVATASFIATVVMLVWIISFAIYLYTAKKSPFHTLRNAGTIND